MKYEDQFSVWKHQFHVRKVGVIMVWTILVLAPLVILGRQVKSPSKPELTYSINEDVGLIGESNLCIVIGGVIGSYSAGGGLGDVYEWKITKSTGEVLLIRRGGDQYESIQFFYTETGDYTVSLKIRRGTDSYFPEETLNVKVQKGPELVLKQDYLICEETPVLLTALNPTTPSFSDYNIIWKSLDVDGNQVVIGTGNEYLAFNNGYHFVELYLTNADGTQACSINASTFVGPPVDFQITQSDEEICEGESIILGTDTPLTGEWFIRKSGATTKTSLGRAFEITLGSSNLSGPGVYEVFFSAVKERYPDCPSERKTAFELLESPTVNAQILVMPDDCNTENGSFQIISNLNLDSIVIPELGVSESPVLAGQVLTYSNLKPKIYSIVATQNGCEITKLVQLEAKNPSPDQLTSTITNFPETCSVDGVTKGKIKVDFGQPIANGEYRLFSVSRGQIDASAIPANGVWELDLSSGRYVLEKVIDGCTYPNESFIIADQPQVEFNIPRDFLICDNFDFIPETDEDLLFTLTFPDGSTQVLDSGQPFSLALAGSYSLKAEANDPLSTLCPREKEFNVTVSKKINFEPNLVEKGCFDPIQYIADIQGLLPEETSIRWLNSEDVIVGRGLTFYPGSIGIFSLIVQPLGSGFCDVAPIEFEVVAPITSVPMELEATKICPEPGFALVTLTTDEEEVLYTEWIFYDPNDQRKELPKFNDLLEIVVDEAGTYEAVAFNKFRCEIGRNLILVEESSLLALPNLDESYPICLKNNILSPIDPGDYEKYEWFFEEQLISTERLYKPVQVGDYRLLVTTVDGCEFEAIFRSYDVCDYQLVYPNAMVLGDPQKNFRVLVSEGVTEAELFILNRQGKLIYHTSTNDIPLEMPIFTWDGKASGEYVPTGNYIVIIRLRNALSGLEETETVPLLVID